MKKVIAFTLYGNNPRYTVGAVKNAALAAKIYPEFIARFYIGADVPHATISTIGLMPNVELFRVEGDHGQFNNAWRFLAFSDPEVEIAIMRDADARITVRERLAVDEWLQSGLTYHSMKDHPTGHAAWPINAGMWGGYTKNIKNMHEIMQQFRAGKETRSFAADQVFLSRHVAGEVYTSMMLHDTFNRTKLDPPSVRRSFPVPITSLSSHVGAAVDENDMFVYGIDKKTSMATGGNGFFQYDIPVPSAMGAIDIPARKSRFISSSNFHDFKNSDAGSGIEVRRPPRGAFVKADKEDGGIDMRPPEGAFVKKKIEDEPQLRPPDGAFRKIYAIIPNIEFVESKPGAFSRIKPPKHNEQQLTPEQEAAQFVRTKPPKVEEQKLTREQQKEQFSKKNRPLR